MWLPAARRKDRREEDEDEEGRDQEHRGGPRQDGGRAARVGFHVLQTPGVGVVLRAISTDFSEALEDGCGVTK
jgi:hypothetical protein